MELEAVDPDDRQFGEVNQEQRATAAFRQTPSEI